jgi:hypothetical protein
LLKCGIIDKSEVELDNEFFDDLKSISFFQWSGYVIHRNFLKSQLVNVILTYLM